MRWQLWVVMAAAAVLNHPQSLVQAARLQQRPNDLPRPLVLLPGFACSQLISWQHNTCEGGSFQQNLYRDIKIGDRIWLDVARSLAQSECWVRCMKLHPKNQSEVTCKLRPGEGLGAIADLDPGIVTGPLSTVWRPLYEDLVANFNYDPEKLIVATYDWRLPPSKLEDRDHFFFSLMKRIEHAVYLHRRELQQQQQQAQASTHTSNQPFGASFASSSTGGTTDPTSSGVVVIGHSMGNNIFRYFLAWLQHEIGANHYQEWIDQHISTYFAVGTPFLGSNEALELALKGATEGIPVALREMRLLQMSFGSLINLLPIPTGYWPKEREDPIVTIEFTQQKKKVTYTATDIASGKIFRDLAKFDPILEQLDHIRRVFYDEDPVMNHSTPWTRPPIRSVYAVYGIGAPAKDLYHFDDSDPRNVWHQLSIDLENRKRPRNCGKTGDLTVTYHSLSWAHTWLGPKGTEVNVTQTPQSVYFSPESIKRFRVLRRGPDSHHADYLLADSGQEMCPVRIVDPLHDKTCSSNETDQVQALASAGFLSALFGPSRVDRTTFYENTFMKNGVLHSTSVWEIDNSQHREILANPVFTRELRAELRHIFKGEAFSADKSFRPPLLDSDCYWNYRQARCEFREHCEYRYRFGDLTLDQSCRIRRQRDMMDLTQVSKLFNDAATNAGLLDHDLDDLDEDTNQEEAFCYIHDRPFCVASCVYCAASISTTK